ncbi:unnamed protein product, partial [Iphiclides podalirius]
MQTQGATFATRTAAKRDIGANVPEIEYTLYRNPCLSVYSSAIRDRLREIERWKSSATPNQTLNRCYEREIKWTIRIK